MFLRVVTDHAWNQHLQQVPHSSNQLQALDRRRKQNSWVVDDFFCFDWMRVGDRKMLFIQFVFFRFHLFILRVIALIGYYGLFYWAAQCRLEVKSIFLHLHTLTMCVVGIKNHIKTWKEVCSPNLVLVSGHWLKLSFIRQTFVLNTIITVASQCKLYYSWLHWCVWLKWRKTKSTICSLLFELKLVFFFSMWLC